MKLAILIVAHNSATTIAGVISKLLADDLEKSIFILDNASKDETVSEISKYSEVSLIESSENLGFCRGNNILLNRAYRLSFSHFLFLNPDAAPLPGVLEKLMKLAVSSSYQAFTPKILRATEKLELIEPHTIDAAGMYFTKNFRHLDCGSGELDSGQYEQMLEVSGGTGAALLVTRSFVEKVSFVDSNSEFEFFDERFFAYREDAELALRANRYGLKYLYVPLATFCHVRKVLPERRSQLTPFLNALSVKNRTLLLFSHYSLSLPIRVQFSTLLRNILVFGYVIIAESESRRALFRAITEYSAHINRRKTIFSKSKISSSDYNKLFQ